MAKFYAIGVKKNGESVIIDNLPETRVQAENVAWEHCDKEGLYCQGVYLSMGTQKQAGVLTKGYKQWKHNKPTFMFF